MPQILAIALPKVARTSPTLPPSAIRAQAMSDLSCRPASVLAGRLPRPDQDHADIVENRGDRRVRLVHGDLDDGDAGKRRQDRLGDRAGSAFQQLVIDVLEGGGRGRDHVGIGNRVGEAIGARGFRQIGRQFEVDDEALANLGLMLHHAVAGMDHDAGDEDRIAHRLSSIAAATRSACTVSATSWVRMIRAPRCAASRCAAIEPPRRWCGSDGEITPMKRLRDAPTKSGSLNTLSSSSRASAVMLWCWVLPKPMPGSSTIFSVAMPALAAIASERSK